MSLHLLFDCDIIRPYKGKSPLHSRLPYYTLSSWFKDTSYYKNKNFSCIINPLFHGLT